MTYLGRCFSFSSDGEKAKELFLTCLKDLLHFTDSLPTTPQLKCHALNLQMRSKLSFNMSHYPASNTWLKNILDPLVTERVRHWLDMPPGATAHDFPLPYKLLGLDLFLPSILSEVCQLGIEITLMQSKDSSMAALHSLAPKHTPAPFLSLLVYNSRKTATKEASTIQRAQQIQKLNALDVQSLLLQSFRSALLAAELTAWSAHIGLIPPSISSFARKALIRCLSTNSNLHCWHPSHSPSCPNCQRPKAVTPGATIQC